MDDRFKTESMIGMGQNMQMVGIVGLVFNLSEHAQVEVAICLGFVLSGI